MLSGVGLLEASERGQLILSCDFSSLRRAKNFSTKWNSVNTRESKETIVKNGGAMVLSGIHSVSYLAAKLASSR